MIFVTVGTHEQQFDRLLKKIDQLIESGIIKEKVIMQTGFSEYEPKNCQWTNFVPYDQMLKNIQEARIIITHGGPSSFLVPIKNHKVPIVVPRQVDFKEHVNNHQKFFCEEVSKIYNNILLIEDVNDLEDAIVNYDEKKKKLSQSMVNNNEIFCEKFERIAEELVNG